ncbi:putative uncharacterized protein C8orf89 homolog [Rhinoderma darwinii]|uniref:putative uncharacterized protein C8orf89 homolog n=1 Tax=Rhinoderma darwinii TaxID=43563 RepID=UPI003F66CCFC
MRRQSTWKQQHNLHVRGSNLLDFSCSEARFTTTAPPFHLNHSSPIVLPALKCRTLKLPSYISKPYVSELSWRDSSAMAEKKSFSIIYKANPNPPTFNGEVPGIKVNQFPRLQHCRGYTLCSSTLYRDRSTAACSQPLSHQKQKTSSGYSDPLNGASIEYIQRLSAIATFENETIRQENTRKLKTKKEQ